MIIDLFCGAGGFSLGAHHAGFKTALAIDIDKALTSSFQENFPESKLELCDLASISASSIKAEMETCAFGLIGGPPCQGFSNIGHGNPDDPRNRLLNRFFYFVAKLRPHFFVMENVPGLLTRRNRVQLDEGLNLLPSRYNILPPMLLSAERYGAATVRPRVIVIGYDRENTDLITTSEVTSLALEQPVTVGEAIRDLPTIHPSRVGSDRRSYPKKKQISRYAKKMRYRPTSVGCGSELPTVSGCQGTEHTKDVICRFASVMPGKRDEISKFQRLAWDRPATVLRAGTGADRGSFQAARPIHPSQNRVVTVREAARIQGFPDWFEFHSTKWTSHRMIGNSVSPIFAEKILRLIRSKTEI